MAIDRAAEVLFEIASRDLENDLQVYVLIAGSCRWLRIDGIKPYRGTAPVFELRIGKHQVIAINQEDLRAVRSATTALNEVVLQF